MQVVTWHLIWIQPAHDYPLYAGYTFRCTSLQTVWLSEQAPGVGMHWEPNYLQPEQYLFKTNTCTRYLQSFVRFLQQTNIFKIAEILSSMQWVKINTQAELKSMIYWLHSSDIKHLYSSLCQSEPSKTGQGIRVKIEFFSGIKCIS